MSFDHVSEPEVDRMRDSDPNVNKKPKSKKDNQRRRHDSQLARQDLQVVAPYLWERRAKVTLKRGLS